MKNRIVKKSSCIKKSILFSGFFLFSFIIYSPGSSASQYFEISSLNSLTSNLVDLDWKDSVVEKPHGIYCSCPRTNASGSESVLTGVAEKDFVDGFFVRVWWRDLEPEDNNINWDLFDSQIEKAQQYGKKVTLAILSGPRTPDWLYDQGAASLSYTFQFLPAKMPLPWDPVFQEKWSEIIREFGERYNDENTVTMVHMTTSTKNGLEMQQPDEMESAPGYSQDAIVNSTKQMMDVYAAAFPSKFLDIDLHPVLDQDTVSQQAASYGHDSIGERFGVFASWWTKNNTSVYPTQWSLLSDSAQRNFGSVQFANSAKLTPSAFDPDGITGTINLATESGIRYMEIWNNDLLESSFADIFSNLNNNVNLSHSIWRKTRKSAYRCVAESPLGVEEYEDSTTKPKTRYYYKICRGACLSPGTCTPEISVQTMSRRQIKKPGLIVSRYSGYNILNWTPEYTEDFDIVVQKKTRPSKRFRTLAVLEGNESSYIDTEAISGKRVTYRIIVKKSGKKAVYSRKVAIICL